MVIADTMEQFKQAAELRLSSAQQLGAVAGNDPEQLATACYLGGYVVEMLLKAAILKEDPAKAPLSKYAEVEAARCDCHNDDNELVCRTCGAWRMKVTHPYRTHSLRTLIRELTGSDRFGDIVKDYKGRFLGWNAEVRYSTEPWVPNPNVARTFLQTVCDFSNDMREGGLGA